MENTPAIAVCISYSKPSDAHTHPIWNYEHGISNPQYIADMMQIGSIVPINKIIIIQNTDGIPTEVATFIEDRDFTVQYDDDFDSLPKYADDPEF